MMDFGIGPCYKSRNLAIFFFFFFFFGLFLALSTHPFDTILENYNRVLAIAQYQIPF